MMKIVIIDEQSPFLEQVISLGDKYKKALGFFPHGAFIEQAIRKKVIVALIENKVAGYALFNINQKASLVYIVHLCIDTNFRKKGIGKALIDKISKITQTLSGIRVHCRRDFEASSFWPKVGFIAKGEKLGRAMQETTLTIWFYDYGHPSIFQYMEDERVKSKTKVVIDANIFFELNKTRSEFEEVQGLLADWIDEDIVFCLTPEIFNEINRNENEEVRIRTRKNAESYYILTTQQDKVSSIYSKLSELYPKHLPDMRQLAHTISSQIQFFITLDDWLLKKSDEIFDSFDTKIIRPAQFIIQHDSLIRESDYQPSKLEGSNIVCSRFSANQYELIEQIFRDSQNEKKSQFISELNKYVSSPLEYDIRFIEDDGKPIALMVVEKEQDSIINVPLFRVIKNQIGAVIANHLTSHLILQNPHSKRLLINISDPFLPSEVIQGLIKLGFTSSNSKWLKVNLYGVLAIPELTHEIKHLAKKYQEHANFFNKVHRFFLSSNVEDIDEYIKIERVLFPLKIKELQLPCYIVPIRPEWAMNLFDSKLARQDLFGGDPNLLFNVENVYYRASTPQIIKKVPGRILWYVTKGDGQSSGLMSINACSYINEVFVDKPKQLFKKNKRLGVYKWQDVYEVAHKNIKNDVMAFKFDFTEQFSGNIKREKIKEIWNKENESNFHPMTVIEISQELFHRFYKIGKGY
jgi:predicted nucleic acid-binding protein